MAEVSLSRIVKLYGRAGVAAVDDVTFTVEDGEFFSLLGPSGCGKSTTLRMIAGLESITRGTLSIDGRVMNGVPAKDRDIAMVFQSYALYPHMTIAGNLAFGLRRRAVSKREIAHRVQSAAKLLGLADMLERKPFSLSGGQRQRVALGRAIVRNPKVFLFDEPLSNLDAALRVSMRNEIVAQHRRLGTTMVYVTHDQLEAMTMSHRICIMSLGRVVQVGKPMEIYRDPADVFVATFLGSPPMNILAADVDLTDGVMVRIGDHALPLVGWQATDLAGRAKVLFGIRPEFLYEGHSIKDGSTPATIRAKVITVEPLGAETLIRLDIGGENELTARIEGESGAATDDVIDVLIDTSATRLFDTDTRTAIPRFSAR